MKKENFQEEVEQEHQKEEFLTGKKKEGFSNYQIQKLDKKDRVIYIYAGKPSERYQAKYGNQPRIQLNDKFSVVSDVGAYILAERATKREELQNVLTTALKVDGETNMGLISDIKQELRKVNALKINYTTRIGDYTQNK